MEKRIMELLEKQFLSFEEFEELEEVPDLSCEDCGMSGQHINKHWYVFRDAEGEEYDIYVS